MARKKSNKPPKTSESLNPRGTEELMASLHRLLAEQNFETIEDVNQFMQQLVDSGKPIEEASPRTPLEEAQEIMYEAWDTRNRRKRISLAHKALEISPDCADAYVLLAEEKSRTPDRALEYYRQGMEAGERALGKEAFEEDAGHFWGILETRPYMRARFGYAQLLHVMDRHQEAADHMQELLRLNPGDNQGVRYLLIAVLFELDDQKALDKLLKEYEDDWSATWKYTLALVEFRNKGDGKKARKLLTQAVDHNPFVPEFLLGKRKMPKTMPQYYSPGDVTEAVEYVLEGRKAWEQIPGALDWLRESLAE